MLILLLWIIPTWKRATCKICWEQGHGFPINFVIIDNVTGLHPSYTVGYFNVCFFLIDIFMLYLLICAIVSIASKSRPENIEA